MPSQTTDAKGQGQEQSMTAPAPGSKGRLERFKKAKERELAELAGGIPAPFEGRRPSFRAALEKPGPIFLVAEYKRASPSRGVICESVTVEEASLAYARGGARALSILTEEDYFRGSLDYLFLARKTLDRHDFGDIPLLRKDFLFEEKQVLATAATPASAFLLIVRQSPDTGLLRALREAGESFGMDAVVEVFDEEDLEIARASGARVIQVNARDLETFHVDREACLKLAEKGRPAADEVWIAASGMEAAQHLLEAGKVGYSAALVGTALMEGGRLEENLARLVAGLQEG